MLCCLSLTSWEIPNLCTVPVSGFMRQAMRRALNSATAETKDRKRKTEKREGDREREV